MSPALLLDTHAYAWAVTAPDRLSDPVRERLVDPDVEVLVPVVAVWEMAIKLRAGRWPEAATLLRRHDDLVRQLGARSHLITAGDAALAGGLEWEHRDPFDRMLAAQALLAGATLVSRDAAFAQLPGLSRLW